MVANLVNSAIKRQLSLALRILNGFGDSIISICLSASSLRMRLRSWP